MSHLKPLTILHSNDLHGDFMSEENGGVLSGGVSLLSGYINEVRQQQPNTLYVIAGDMFRGSLIDSEYRGLSTIQIMNLLAPDVVALGNHEVDYGLSHLLFLEKCAKFPIINANIYETVNHSRLFRSHLIKKVDGMKILFIGILTEEVMDQARTTDQLISTMVDVADAAQEVGKICDSYRHDDIDFTVLLTHIGIEADKQLAALLDPRWGVDLIIGGHSHTLMSEPAVVNGIPIVQAAMGTDQIGRFDIMVNTDTNAIESYQWQLVPIDDAHCPRDTALEELVQQYRQQTDDKYLRVLTRISSSCTHPSRYQETTMGRVFSDALKEMLELDVMLMGSGSLRQPSLGPILTLKAFREVYPYADPVYRCLISGALFRKMVLYILRDEAFSGDHTEFFQFSTGLKIDYVRKTHELKEFSFQGRPIGDDQILKVGVPGYHFVNCETSLGVTQEELAAAGKPKEACTNSQNVLEEYFSDQELVRVPLDKRLIVE
jgi:5'-nucleotidase